MFSIKPTDDAMQLRESAKKAGHSTAEIRRFGTHHILGGCETCDIGRSMLSPETSIAVPAQS